MGSYNTHDNLLEMHCLALYSVFIAMLCLHCRSEKPSLRPFLRCSAIINLPLLLLSLSLETTVLSAAAAACFRQSTCTCLVSTTSTAPMVNCKSTFYKVWQKNSKSLVFCLHRAVASRHPSLLHGNLSSSAKVPFPASHFLLHAHRNLGLTQLVIFFPLTCDVTHKENTNIGTTGLGQQLICASGKSYDGWAPIIVQFQASWGRPPPHAAQLPR